MARWRLQLWPLTRAAEEQNSDERRARMILTPALHRVPTHERALVSSLFRFSEIVTIISRTLADLRALRL